MHFWNEGNHSGDSCTALCSPEVRGCPQLHVSSAPSTLPSVGAVLGTALLPRPRQPSPGPQGLLCDSLPPISLPRRFPFCQLCSRATLASRSCVRPCPWPLLPRPSWRFAGKVGHHPPWSISTGLMISVLHDFCMGTLMSPDCHLLPTLIRMCSGSRK